LIVSTPPRRGEVNLTRDGVLEVNRTMSITAMPGARMAQFSDADFDS